MSSTAIFFIAVHKLHPKMHYALKYMAAISNAS